MINDYSAPENEVSSTNHQPIILYKLIFPSTGQFYVGSTILGSSRYKGQKLNDTFEWRYAKPHSCAPVADLFANGEFCYWYVVAEFATKAEARKAEKNLLLKLDGCEWLLNIRRGSYEPQIDREKQIASTRRPETHEKRMRTWKERGMKMSYTTAPCPKCGEQHRPCNLTKHVKNCKS